MKKTLFAAASVGACLFAAAPAANAQSVYYGALEQMFGEPVTTSATGSPQRSTEVPVNMDIISAADIKRSGATDLPTILSRVAGVDLLQAGAAGADVGIRGYNQGMSPRLLVLINGRQVYLDHYGYTAWATLPVQLEEIRQIEVVKGPNSALFGFNAVSGVVNIITYSPQYDDIKVATVRAGTGGHAEASLVDTFHLGNRFSGRFSAGAAQMDEWKNTAGVAAYSLQDPARVSANLDTVTQLNAKTELRVEGSWSNVLVSDLNSGNSYSPTKYVTSSIKAGVASDTRFGAAEVSAYQNKLSAKSRAGDQAIPYDNKITVVSARDLFKLGAKHTFRVGAEYRHNQSHTQPITGGTISYEVLVVSGMWNWAVTDQLTTTVAVRHDTLDLERKGTFPTQYVLTDNANWDRTIKETSYNLGVVYRPSNFDTLRLTAARGVQVPTLVDLGSTQLKVVTPSFTLGIVGNPFLKPAIVTNYELGYDRVLPSLNAKLGVAVFAQKTVDIKGQPTLRAPDYLPTATTIMLASFRNVGDSKMKGVELKASGQFAGGYHWSGDYTWTDVDDEPPAGVTLASLATRSAAFSKTTPAYRGNVAFGRENQKWSVDGFLHYVSDFDGYSSAGTFVPVKGYVTLAGRIARQFDKDFTVALSGQNLLKARQTQMVGLEAERRVYLTLSKSW